MTAHIHAESMKLYAEDAAETRQMRSNLRRLKRALCASQFSAHYERRRAEPWGEDAIIVRFTPNYYEAPPINIIVAKEGHGRVGLSQQHLNPRAGVPQSVGVQTLATALAAAGRLLQQIEALDPEERAWLYSAVALACRQYAG